MSRLHGNVFKLNVRYKNAYVLVPGTRYIPCTYTVVIGSICCCMDGACPNEGTGVPVCVYSDVEMIHTPDRSDR